MKRNASSQKNDIISILESSKDEMFEQTKKEFLQENGVLNGDTTTTIRCIYKYVSQGTEK